MEQRVEKKWIMEMELKGLRQLIEKKRSEMDSKIRGRADLLEHQELSRELDQLIGEYLGLKVEG